MMGIPMSELNNPLPSHRVKVMDKAEIKEPRRSSRPHKSNPSYRGVASTNSIDIGISLIGYLKQCGHFYSLS